MYAYIHTVPVFGQPVFVESCFTLDCVAVNHLADVKKNKNIQEIGSHSHLSYSIMDYKRTIEHSASGAKCTVHDFGATVLSFQTSSGRECLFLSRDAKLDGSKAVRGGIPLVFPQFGQPDTSMPQHGFLRTNFWKADESSVFDDEEEAGITYSLDLKDVKSSRGGKWDEDTEYDCKFRYTVKISASKMTTSLEITNTGDKAFEFQTLQHTYFMVDAKSAQDPAQCYVQGLEGYCVVDKVTNTEYPNREAPVVIPDNVDRVYNPPDGKDVVEVVIGVGGGKRIKLTAIGTLDGTSTPVSCVVWNPYKDIAASMADFGDDQVRSKKCNLMFVFELIA